MKVKQGVQKFGFAGIAFEVRPRVMWMPAIIVGQSRPKMEKVLTCAHVTR